ncbi:MAG: hypothetical protein IPL35_17650 [Sphingobacteriales bacterium]|nr:hypothetical protein [Sphingobacteriales bacterium]
MAACEIPNGEGYKITPISGYHLTVNASGNCPNMGECWECPRNYYFYDFWGNVCTRSCSFAAPPPPEDLLRTR